MSGRYSALRFQVDPVWPPPQWDWRWIGMVLGSAAIVVAIFLLLVAWVLTAALGWGPPACGLDAGCGALSIADGFEWAGLALLALGVVVALASLIEGVRHPA